MRRKAKLTALSISAIYFAFAMLWILFSDQLLEWVSDELSVLSFLQTIKGTLFVTVTSLFLFFLLRKYEQRIHFKSNQLDEIMDSAQMATWSLNLETGETAPSKNDYKLFGFAKAPDRWTVDDFFRAIHQDDRDRVKQALEQAITNKTPYESIYRVVWPNGETHWMHSQGIISNDEYGEPCMVGIVEDITLQKDLEEAFTKEKELFERVFEKIPVMVDIYNTHVDDLRVNQAFEDILGWTSEELVGMDVMKKFYPDEQERNRAMQIMSKADGSWHEFTVTDKYGQKHIQRWTNVKLSNDAILGIGLDITEQKKLETKLEQEREELKKSRNLFNKAEQIAKLGHWKRDLINDRAFWSDGFYNIIEVAKGSRGNEFGSLMDMIHPDDREPYRRAYESAIKSGYFNFYFRLKKQRSEEIGHYHELGHVEYNEEGKAVSVSGTIQEITNIVESQSQLQESQRLLRKTFESLNESVIIIEPGTRVILDCNPSTERIFGIEKEELIGKDTRIFHVDEESFHEFQNLSIVDLEESGVFHTEYRMKKKNGEIFYSDHTVTFVYDDDGNIDKVVSVTRDITEIKKAEFELQQEKKRFELVANTTSDVIWDYDVVKDVLWRSEGVEKILGSKVHNLTSDLSSWTDNIHPDDKKRAIESLQKALKSDIEYWSEQYRLIREDSSIAYIEDNGIIIRDDKGDAVQVIGTMNDVTERKLAEERLLESEFKYRRLFKLNPQPMFIYNPENLKFVEVNEAAIHHYGYSEEEFLKMTIADIRPKKDISALKKVVEQHKKSQKPSFGVEWTHIKKDGTPIIVAISSSNIQYEDQTYRMVLASDITEQKKAEERVVASLVEGENRERKRLAQELHDGLGQYLAAANMNLDSIQDDLSMLTEKKQKQFMKGLHFLKHAITETRSISHNLMPRAVEDYGLPLALEALIDNYRKSTNIEFYYYQNLNGTHLHDEVAINIYRIAQEGISNAIKYAEATRINIQLVKDGLDLILTIDDNGIGFELESPNFKAGLGLQTIKTRTDAIAGSLDIETKPGSGTLLNVIVPISGKK